MNVAIKGLRVARINVRRHDGTVRRHPSCVAELDGIPDSLWLQSFDSMEAEDGCVSPSTFHVNGRAVSFECFEERFEEHVHCLKKLVRRTNAMCSDYESDRNAEAEKQRVAAEAAIAQKEDIKRTLEEKARVILAS
jgi:hypothetical protein